MSLRFRIKLRIPTTIIITLLFPILVFLNLPQFVNWTVTLADHCPYGYDHFPEDIEDIAGGNFCQRSAPSQGCESNEIEQNLVGHDFCILVSQQQDDNQSTGNVQQFPLPDSPELASKGFTGENLVAKLISDILPIVLGLGGFLTVIIIVISGIQFITSSGNPEAAAAARSRLIFALVGFAIIILAFAITQIIDKIFLGGSGAV